jgi:hypothetical protein
MYLKICDFWNNFCSKPEVRAELTVSKNRNFRCKSQKAVLFEPPGTSVKESFSIILLTVLRTIFHNFRFGISFTFWLAQNGFLFWYFMFFLSTFPTVFHFSFFAFLILSNQHFWQVFAEATEEMIHLAVTVVHRLIFNQHFDWCKVFPEEIY